LGVLELLDDTVVVLVIDGLADSVTLPYELTEGDEEMLLDICADSEDETDEESTLEIDGDPVTLYDSEFEYERTLLSETLDVFEVTPVNVKRPLIVCVSVRISVRVPVDVTEGVAVFVFI
jgi:hypothetical protein